MGREGIVLFHGMKTETYILLLRILAALVVVWIAVKHTKFELPVGGGFNIEGSVNGLTFFICLLLGFIAVYGSSMFRLAKEVL